MKKIKLNTIVRTMVVFVIISALIFLVIVEQANGAVKEVTVSKNKILFDGKDELIKGYIFQNFLYSVKQLKACSETEKFCEKLITARDFYYGRGKFKENSGLDVASRFGGNTIRFNLNQANLARNSSAFSKNYVSEVSKAVKFARSKGFVVILALFDSRNKNAPKELWQNNPRTPLNNKTSLSAAKLLAKDFGQDTGVIIELLNESFSPAARKKGWLLWRDGGTRTKGKFAGQSFIGVNQMIKAIRALNAKNVIIMQGLGASFKEFPGGVVDPLNRIAFSAHPFLGRGEDEKLDWDGNFGDFSDSHPFVITAWNNPARKPWCKKLGVSKPQEFLEYIRKKRIGLVAFAMDVPYTILKDFRKSTSITTKYSLTCKKGDAAGQLVKEYFNEN